MTQTTEQEQEQKQKQEFTETKEQVEMEGRAAWITMVSIASDPELQQDPDVLRVMYEANDRWMTANYRLKEHQYRV